MNVYFFISSTLVSSIAFLLIEVLRGRRSLILDVLIEMVAYTLLFLIPKSGFLIASIIAVLHGATTSFNLVLKSAIVLIADKERRKSVNGRLFICRSMISVISGLVGQELYIASGNYPSSIILSLLMMFIALITATLFDEMKIKSLKFSEHLFKPITMLRNMRKVYTRHIFMLSLLATTGHLLHISLAFYSGNIFIERKKNTERNLRFSRALSYIAIPFKLFAVFVVNFISIFDSKTRIAVNTKENDVLYGYVDGLTKIVSATLVYIISSFPKTDFQTFCGAFIIALLAMVAIYALGQARSLTSTYLLYIVAYSLSYASKQISNNGLSSYEDYTFVISANLFFTSIVHIALSYLALFTNADVKKKLQMYFYFTSILLLIFLFLAIIPYFKV